MKCDLCERLKEERDKAYAYEGMFRTFLRRMLTALEPPFSPDQPWNRSWRTKIQNVLDGRLPAEETRNAEQVKPGAYRCPVDGCSNRVSLYKEVCAECIATEDENNGG